MSTSHHLFSGLRFLISVDTCYEMVADQIKGTKQNEELEHLSFFFLIIINYFSID